MLKKPFLKIFFHQSKLIFPFSTKEVFDLRKPDKKPIKTALTAGSTRTLIIHPVFYPKFLIFFPNNLKFELLS